VLASFFGVSSPVQAATRPTCSKLSTEFAVCSVGYTVTKGEATRVTFEVQSPKIEFYLHVISDGTGDREDNQQTVLLDQKVSKKKWCGPDSRCGHPRKFDLPFGADQAFIQITKLSKSRGSTEIFAFAVKDPFAWSVASLSCSESDAALMKSLCMSHGGENVMECLEATEFLEGGIDHRASDRLLLRKWYGEKAKLWAFFLLSTTVLDSGPNVRSGFSKHRSLTYDVMIKKTLAELITNGRAASSGGILRAISTLMTKWIEQIKGFDADDWELAEAGIAALADTKMGGKIMELASSRDCSSL